MAGIFCVSLDTEYFWGVHDTATLEEYGKNVENGRKIVIPETLSLFDKYGIHATWAMVGAAMAKTAEEMEEYMPDLKNQPSYCNPIRNPYHLVNESKESDFLRFILYAKSDIERIKEVKGQEIGTHTFSHYYCEEAGQTLEQFKADIQAALKIAKSNGLSIRSIVFPKLEYKRENVNIVRDAGIRVYRGMEDNWIYRIEQSNILKRGFRLLDVYFPISGHNCHSPIMEDGILNLTGSRIFKPYNPKLSFLEPLKIRRIKNQMEYAAKHALVFHLWWHPHNFGSNTDLNLQNLEEVLKYYKQCSLKYGMKSMNMSEIFDQGEF